MKTAISIPDQVFLSGEDFAHRSGISRSELYTKALFEYLKLHKNENVTEKLNQIYGDESSSLDKELRLMQSNSIPKEEW